ncbi:MAG: hypothetical protein U5L00_15965 [Desulfovermiculus sp.]|nr:hypothetical protein [Desulfovermiculus sp.]
MRIEEIKNTVVLLPVDKYRQFRDWFLEHDWEQWDKQIKADSGSGKLDFLIEEAMDEKNKRKNEGSVRKGRSSSGTVKVIMK